MTGTLLPQATFREFDDAGFPLAGGQLYTYVPGTTTPRATYIDAELTVPNTNPVILDAQGRASVFVVPGTSYRLQLRTALGALIWDRDSVPAIPSSGSEVDTVGIAGETIGNGSVVCLSNGSAAMGGPATAGRWVQCISISQDLSTRPPIVGVVASTVAVVAGAAVTVRLRGKITFFGGLVPGQPYYISAVLGTMGLAGNRLIGVAASTTDLIIAPENASAAVHDVPIDFGGTDEGPGVTSLSAAYPPGGAYTACMPGTAIRYFDTGKMPPGSYVLEAMLRASLTGGGSVGTAYAQLTNLLTDVALIPEITATTLSGIRVQSAPVIFNAPGSGLAPFAIKVRSGGTTTAAWAWGCRLVRVP